MPASEESKEKRRERDRIRREVERSREADLNAAEGMNDLVSVALLRNRIDLTPRRVCLVMDVLSGVNKEIDEAFRYRRPLFFTDAVYKFGYLPVSVTYPYKNAGLIEWDFVVLDEAGRAKYSLNGVPLAFSANAHVAKVTLYFEGRESVQVARSEHYSLDDVPLVP